VIRFQKTGKSTRPNKMIPSASELFPGNAKNSKNHLLGYMDTIFSSAFGCIASGNGTQNEDYGSISWKNKE
jgi:hypothetical protein